MARTWGLARAGDGALSFHPTLGEEVLACVADEGGLEVNAEDRGGAVAGDAGEFSRGGRLPSQIYHAPLEFCLPHLAA